ncbi:MAG: 2-phospho-L-lactate guanylyltransferase [Halieaceae bacterium]|mgnify:CR=1 FL=1|jgi:2-phospho-L-lactate/phosphoenolpyruvate guanylyltransferase|nr:2-phospho-L-lactate guanylyltransferase [Halieaceae bacterium]
MAQALVPLKDLVAAKSRLSGVLNPSERRALAQAMVEDVLAVLSEHPQVDGVTLVSDDPGAELLAAKYNVDCWDDRSLGCSGLSAVIARSCDMLLQNTEAPLLVLHGDLPLLGRDDISAMLACVKQNGGLVIGCDGVGQGSNFMAFDAAGVPDFSYGRGSCYRHLQSVRRRGQSARVIRRRGIALDVDSPQDLALLLTQLEAGAKSQTADLLVDTELGRRIGRLLESLQPQPQNLNIGKVQ